MLRKLYISALLGIAFLVQANGQDLFESDELLQIRIKFDVKETITDRDIRDEHAGILYYGDTDSLTIKLTVRGKTRANPKLCRFPPLRLNFKKKEVKGTLFRGQNKLKLVTHCNDRSINTEYILREYYVYKMYQLLTPFSFRVRLCSVIYDDVQGKFDSNEYYGFLIEDIDDLAARNSMEEYDKELLNQDAFYRPALDNLVLFQFMIGNLDWSVPKQHNFKLIYGEALPVPVAVPYDFDFSGIVNTNYAQPPEGIDVSSVRQRNFRGFCRTPGTYEAVAQQFIDLKNEFYAIYTSSEYLSEKSIQQSIKYLDSFYEILENEKEFRRKILKACRVDHKHLYK